MHELQSLLLQKLPRLSKLIFGGRIRLVMEEPLGHNHILEALGKDFAMTGDYQLLFFPRWHTSMVFWMDMWPQWIEKGITLPSNISDLSLPEYEETRKQLISLLK